MCLFCHAELLPQDQGSGEKCGYVRSQHCKWFGTIYILFPHWKLEKPFRRNLSRKYVKFPCSGWLYNQRQRFELCEEADSDYLVELELNKQNSPEHQDSIEQSWRRSLAERGNQFWFRCVPVIRSTRTSFLALRHTSLSSWSLKLNVLMKNYMALVNCELCEDCISPWTGQFFFL